MMRRRHAVWPSAKLATFIGGCALIALASACGSDLAAGGPVLTTQGDDDTDAADGGVVGDGQTTTTDAAGTDVAVVDVDADVQVDALSDGGAADTLGSDSSGGDAALQDVPDTGFDAIDSDATADDTDTESDTESDIALPDDATNTSSDTSATDSDATVDGDNSDTQTADSEPTADAGLPCADLGCSCTAKSDCDSGHCAKAKGAAATDPGECAPSCLLATVPDAACADSDACTADVCDPKKGCTHSKSTQACNDGNACTVDGCDATTGCQHAAAAGPCDDDNACTEPDSCAQGTCKAGAPKACDDDSACTTDSCSADLGCVNAYADGPCDDGDACTTGEKCSKGECQPPAKDTCDDDNPCTDDGCDAKTGCTHTANNAACSDGNKCTDGDTCSAGQCAPGVGTKCDDANPCTQNSCDMAVGCTSTALDVLCDDGDKCTQNDKCKAASCVPGVAMICDDGNPCSTDACVAGVCDYTANTDPCEDGDPCTLGDTCSTGSCDSGSDAKICDDGAPCTDDSCAKGKGCVAVPNSATCTDGDACTSGDHCDKGSCIATGGSPCDDNNPCTDDTCAPPSSGKPGTCTNAPNVGACDDGNKCTSADACDAGLCKAGKAVVCDDGNSCTLADCKPADGCKQLPVPGECTDGNVCTAGDACKDGACGAGPGKDCNDNDICTDDSCDAQTGCQHALNTAPCDDGNKCTVGEQCKSGSCTGATAVVCDDSNTCTADSCDGQTGCKYDVKPGIVVPACDGQAHGSSCFKAVPGKRTFAQAETMCIAWGGHLASVHNAAENNVGLSQAMARCGTGQSWIGLTDIVKEGAYAWTDGTKTDYTNWAKNEPNDAQKNEDRAHMLDGGKWNDISNSATMPCAICRRALPQACQDGDACTSGEVCTTGGKCTAAVPNCDDHNSCTVDKCDKTKGCSHTPAQTGSACGSGVCDKAGQCAIGDQAHPAKSCQELADVKALQPANAVYWLDPDGDGKIPKFRTFCAFNPGVGWTLAMKISGASKTFRYDRAYWTDTQGHNTGSVNFDTSEAKLASFWTMPVKQVLLSMKFGSGYTWMVLPKTASSLRAIFATNAHHATTQGRAAWLNMLGDSSLQPHCNREGFNVGDRGAQVRIGIIGNNENDCNSPDSRLGFGGRGNRCGQDDNNTMGNAAKCGGDKGDRNTKVFGYVFIR